jgi:hypothetical protein
VLLMAAHLQFPLLRVALHRVRVLFDWSLAIGVWLVDHSHPGCSPFSVEPSGFSISASRTTSVQRLMLYRQ